MATRNCLIKVVIDGPRCSGKTEFLRWLTDQCSKTERYIPIDNIKVSDPDIVRELGIETCDSQYGHIGKHEMMVVVKFEGHC